MLKEFSSISHVNRYSGNQRGVFKKLLSEDDSLAVLDLISCSRLCASDNEFVELMTRLAELIDADHCMCAYARFSGRRRIQCFDVLNVNFPSEWLETYLAKKYYRLDAVVKENYKHFKIQYWEETYQKCKYADHIISHAREFSLVRGCSYGMKSEDGRGGSLFSFSGPSVIKSERNRSILKIAIPELHARFVSLLNAERETDKRKLTETERRIVECMAVGMSNLDIADVCEIGINTVKFHVGNVMRKMSVENRTQVAAKAHKMGLIK